MSASTGRAELKPRIAAIVLAAGASTRMSGAGAATHSKLLADLDGKPLVAHVVDAVLDAGLEEIIVVTGDASRELREVLHDREVRWAHNSRAADGIGSSIACGVRAVAIDRIDALLVCLGDMPGVRAEHVRLLINAFAQASADRATICLPVRGTPGGRRGHPVLFGAAHVASLCDLTGDHGARQVIAANEGHICEVEIDDPAIHFDIDTLEDLAAARSARR